MKTFNWIVADNKLKFHGMFILEKTEHTINALEVFASDDLYEDNFAVEIISNAKKLVNDAKNTKNVGFFLFVSTLKVFFFYFTFTFAL